MRSLEWSLWLVAALWATTFVAGPARRRIHVWLTVTVAVIAVLHAALEGVRVHMILTYATVVTLIALGNWKPSTSAVHLRSWSRMAIGGATAGWLSVAALAPVIFPVYS